MPSSTSAMLKLAFLFAAGRFAAATSYTLEDSYTDTNFFNGFDFFSGADPTNGFVSYKTKDVANQLGLAGYSDGGIYLGADMNTTLDPNGSTGRASTRVSSTKTYTRMLLVADIAHMPTGCGVWPALWSFGSDPKWPDAGEIDILEGVNSQASNQVTLHTASGCTMKQGSVLASTKVAATSALNCNADNGNTGCPQVTKATNNYGVGFNAQGGGVYAMEWTSTAISVWFFPRNSSVANQLSSGSNSTSSSVDTSNFGTPTAQFQGGDGCTIDDSFKDHNIIIDTTFCGDCKSPPPF